jgi:hypothetical protein
MRYCDDGVVRSEVSIYSLTDTCRCVYKGIIATHSHFVQTIQTRRLRKNDNLVCSLLALRTCRQYLIPVPQPHLSDYAKQSLVRRHGPASIPAPL